MYCWAGGTPDGGLGAPWPIVGFVYGDTDRGGGLAIVGDWVC